jgi:inner membrane protein
MENLTHTLVGLMMARCGLAKNTTHGGGMMMLAANMPDIDTIAWFGGPLTYIEYHRGYAHALASAPLMALIPILLVRAGMSSRTYLASLAGVLSHLLLDWTNVYGIRLLLPFSPRWLHLDITDIVDPWIWVILFVALIAPWLSGLVSREIGESKASGGVKRGWAWFAILALLAFEGARFIAHQRAIDVMNSRLYDGAVARRISALPGNFSPLQWRGVIEGEGVVRIVPIDLAKDFDPTSGRVEYPAPISPSIEAASHSRPFEVFGQFNQRPFWQVKGPTDPAPLDATRTDALRVELIDLRFGTPERPGFEATALVDATGRVLQSEFRFGALPQPK